MTSAVTFRLDGQTRQRVMKIARRADHNPIAAEPFARRRASADVRNIGNGGLFRSLHPNQISGKSTRKPKAMKAF